MESRSSCLAVLRGLTVVASLAAEHRPSARRLQQLQHVTSVAVKHGLSCSALPPPHPPCGTFPDQGLNVRPPHWQADSYPLSHQGSLVMVSKRTFHIRPITQDQGIVLNPKLYKFLTL